MVKVRGQNSNRNKIKQTAENGQKILDDKDAAGIMSLIPGFKIRVSGMVLNSTGRNGFCMAGHLRSDSG